MKRLTFDPLITPNGARSGGGNTIVASEPHAPAHAATLGGTRMNRISAMENGDRDQSRCNNPAGSTKVFWKSLLGADPRAPWEWSNRPHAVDEPAPDIGGSELYGRPCSGPLPDTAVGLARLANAGPPVGRRRCNTASADASAGTASHTPSTSTADAADDTGRGLEPSHIPGHAEAGPRELRTPKRSSRGAEPFIPLRDAFLPAGETPCTSTPATEPLRPPSAHSTVAPLVPPKWSPRSPPPTS
jgi:hypothetical protein